MATKKIIVVPCIVNIWLKTSGPRAFDSRPEQLPAHGQRLDAGDDEEDYRHEHVHDADLLVIDRRHPLVEDGRPRRSSRSAFLFDDGHAVLSRRAA